MCILLWAAVGEQRPAKIELDMIVTEASDLWNVAILHPRPCVGSLAPEAHNPLCYLAG